MLKMENNSIVHILSHTCKSLNNLKSKEKKIIIKNLLECILNM